MAFICKVQGDFNNKDMTGGGDKRDGLLVN